ncbi:MAG TPA: hypothetical protein VG474_01790 [Solirubrobacteraceae bacterium]|nr:hypothetical protein [Solirubrobacteraceae bacterium]
MEASQGEPLPGGSSQDEPLPGDCKDWRALQGPGVIVVDGWCTFPTGGWEMELRKAEPQGVNPEDLILERVVKAPDTYQPPVRRGMEIHWEEQTDAEYKTVTIRPDGLTIEVRDARNEPPPR